MRLHPKTLTLRNKLARFLWNMVWFTLGRPTPVALHRWRCMLARLFGANIGKRIRLYPSARIWAPWNLTMGDDSCLGPDVDCYCVDSIRLGDHAIVSQYSYLCTASHDYTDPNLPLIVAPIVIGDWAWITADVFVGPGVDVGEGAVVNARSSVFDDIEPWTIARGNPARSYKARHLSIDGKSGGN